MGTVRMAVVSAPFGRDVAEELARVAAPVAEEFACVTTLVAEARAAGVGLLVQPAAALGGYRTDLDGEAEPVLDPEGREVPTLAALVEAGRAGMNVLRDRRPGTYAAPDGEPSEAA